MAEYYKYVIGNDYIIFFRNKIVEVKIIIISITGGRLYFTLFDIINYHTSYLWI